MSEIKTRLTADMKEAMRAKDKARLTCIRAMLNEIKKVEVDERIEVDEDRVIALLTKMQKQRKDSLAQFEQAGREDLAAIEKDELEVISQYLPEKLSQEELETLIEQAINQTQAATMADMGKVMGILKPQVNGRADMADISKLIKARLH